MSNGTVKWFNAQKGYGFIQPDGGGKDVFVHVSAVERAGLRDLREGQRVAFEVVVDRKTGKSAAENLKDHVIGDESEPTTAARFFCACPRVELRSPKWAFRQKPRAPIDVTRGGGALVQTGNRFDGGI